MAKRPKTPLDETQWRSPPVTQFWGINENTIHPIFHETTFFDHTTKNGVLFDQAKVDFGLYQMVHNRQAFETRLKQMNGVEYLIVGEPQKEADGTDTGVWVIRKQDRRRRPSRDDEITVLATYYMMGDAIYQAPSVYDIVANKLLSTMNAITKFNQTAAGLPLFTPATGYTYFPPPTNKSLNGTQSVTETSRETSLAPPSQPPTTALDPIGQVSSSHSVPSQSSQSRQDPRNDLHLLETFNMMFYHGDEYMDENPLKGEPGNFVFSATKNLVRAKQAEVEAAKAKELELAKKLEEAKAAAKATPFAAANAKEEKGAEVRKKVKDKIKKRRSKIAGGPSTPASPATPA